MSDKVVHKIIFSYKEKIEKFFSSTFYITEYTRKVLK